MNREISSIKKSNIDERNKKAIREIDKLNDNEKAIAESYIEKGMKPSKALREAKAFTSISTLHNALQTVANKFIEEFGYTHSEALNEVWAYNEILDFKGEKRKIAEKYMGEEYEYTPSQALKKILSIRDGVDEGTIEGLKCQL